MKIKFQLNYSELRVNAYPTVQEQLDMLWHGMNDGNFAKVEPFYSKIKSIKDKYPKSDS